MAFTYLGSTHKLSPIVKDMPKFIINQTQTHGYKIQEVKCNKGNCKCPKRKFYILAYMPASLLEWKWPGHTSLFKTCTARFRRAIESFSNYLPITVQDHKVEQDLERKKTDYFHHF